MAAEDAGLAVALVVECYGVLSYAYSGTKRQVVTRIDVTNTGSVGSAGTLVRPRVRVAAQLAEPLITEWIGAAKALPAVGGPALTWEDALTPMNKPLIAGLTARPPAELVVEVLAGDTVVAVDRRPLTVLQPNQWLHGAEYFDALAGFVHADDKALDALLKSVNALLQARTPFGESQGYKQDSQHVHQVAIAISDVLRGLRIEVRAEPFGVADAVHSLQTPAEIVAGKSATALEVALLVAACLTKANLEAVIFLAVDQVFAGYAITPAVPDENWDQGQQLSVWNTCTVNALVDTPLPLAFLVSKRLVQALRVMRDEDGEARGVKTLQHAFDGDSKLLHTMVVVRRAWAEGITVAVQGPVNGGGKEPATVSTGANSGAGTKVGDRGNMANDAAPDEATREADSEGEKSGNNENEGKTEPLPPEPRVPLTAAELATIAEAVQVQYDIWYQVARWAKETNKLNPFYRRLSYSIGKLRAEGREPSIKQAIHGLILLKLAYRAGFHPS